jgi:hypothetical protein
MPQMTNDKAAQLHEAAAKTHRTASASFANKDAKAGLEHANTAKMQSDEANKSSIAAHAKSAVLPEKH